MRGEEWVDWAGFLRHGFLGHGFLRLGLLGPDLLGLEGGEVEDGAAWLELCAEEFAALEGGVFDGAEVGLFGAAVDDDGDGAGGVWAVIGL